MEKDQEAVLSELPQGNDKEPFLSAEIYPRPAPLSKPCNATQANTVVVATQPENHFDFIDCLIYLSMFTMLCCGFLPGLMAYAMAWEARRRRNKGDMEEAKDWSISAFLCNIFTMLVGIGLVVGIGAYLGYALSYRTKQ